MTNDKIEEVKKERKKIYTEKFRCAKCGDFIGEYSEKNRQRTIKSYYTICMKCEGKAQKEINDLKENELIKLRELDNYYKKQTSKKVEELKNISIPYPLDTTEEFDEGFKFAMKKVREEVNKIFTPESIDNYNKKEAKYNFNEKDILQNHIPQREGSHDLRNSSSLTSSPEEDLCKYGHKKQSPQVFIERVARLDKEGINAICGTDEKYSKYIKKFTKKEVKE